MMACTKRKYMFNVWKRDDLNDAAQRMCLLFDGYIMQAFAQTQ